jgi:kumamolisin
VRLEGTDLAPIPGVRVERAPRSRAPLTLTLHLRSRASADALERALDDVHAGRRAALTRPEFAAEFGASRADIAAVRSFARAGRFRVSGVSVARRILHLTGPADALVAAFGVRRVRYRLGDTAWNSFRGHLYVPAAIAGCVTGVFGFDDRPEVRRHGGRAMIAAAPTAAVSYTAPEVAALYHFPPRDGRGQSVGVIALGGGYRQADLRAYFRALRLPMPAIQAVSVAGGRNAPGGDTAAFDGEVTGDVETVGALVPRARIYVYFAPNTARGFFEAVAAAVHDRRHANTVISISWGQAEAHWRLGTLLAFNRVLLEAAVLGVTVCCSSGDHGSLADARDRTPHVNFPGSSPHALACGGTTLVGRGARIHHERVWHNQTGASGGGVSALFPRPPWQSRSRVPATASGHRGRGVPDVAANADPLTGYRIFGHGHWTVGAGTSAAAPLWAGLVARINQQRGRPLGLVTPQLYGQFAALVKAGAIVPVTRGDNGLFRARKGWSCCTGLGTPRGAQLTRALARRDPHPRHSP